MQTIAQFAVRRRRFVILAWLALFVGIGLVAQAAGGAQFKDDLTLPHTETQQVNDLLKASGLDQQSGQQGSVVIHATAGRLASASSPPGTVDALRSLCATKNGVALISSPWLATTCAAGNPSGAVVGDPQLLSKDGRTAIVNINWEPNKVDQKYATGVYDDLKKLRSPALQVEFTGPAFSALSTEGGIPPELFGFAAALLILVLVFRKVTVAALPLVCAFVALGIGLNLTAVLSHMMSVASASQQLAELIAIGVGVDYALFIVTRHRRNLRRGMPVNESVIAAINTSGRAVLFAGTTVCITILGMCALGVNYLYGIAISTAVSVLFTMLASVTLLPVLLSLLGQRVLSRRMRRVIANGGLERRTRPGGWARWSAVVARRRLVLGLAAGLGMLILALPVFSIRLGSADASTDPAASTTRKGYDLITEGFGKGYNAPLELVVHGPGANDASYLDAVSRRLTTTPGVDATTVHTQKLTDTVAFVRFNPTTSPQDSATTDLVRNLRATLAPVAEAGTQNRIYVFGQTASFIDFAKVLADKMLLFFLAVIGLSVLLLMMAFRSVVIPLTAAVMNVLAVAASFGIVVAIFQWGWLTEALGVGAGGPIDASTPVLFFAILFGLSMDYQVFLVSRMHEEWLHTRDNSRSIRVGQAETGGIITAAAVIMIAVFGGFMLGDQRAIKLIGLGLAAAIFLDAFILRTILVPAVMHALGRANWYYPKVLDRLTPRVSVEAPDDPAGLSTGYAEQATYTRV